MQRDIRQWAQTCTACQKSKVHRHTRAPLGEFPIVTARFAHVHIDIVGSLPPAQGKTYILTMIDRFTRWPVAAPIPDVSSETVTQAFLEHWEAHFGCPVTVTTDRGPQF